MFRNNSNNSDKRTSTCGKLRKSHRIFESLERRELMAGDIGENLPMPLALTSDAEAVSFVGSDMRLGAIPTIMKGGCYPDTDLWRPVLQLQLRNPGTFHVSLDPNAGVLSISGNDNADLVRVYSENEQVVVLIDGPDGWAMREFDGATVTSIVFDGKGGNDELENQTELPVLAYGGVGDDKLIGGVGDDELQGGLGDDVLVGGRGNDRLFGQQGDDNIDGGHGDDLLSGEDGDDLLNGDRGNDLIYGDNGDDDLLGGWGDDELQGGDGNDVLQGGQGVDRLFGDGGQNILDGVVTADDKPTNHAPVLEPIANQVVQLGDVVVVERDELREIVSSFHQVKVLPNTAAVNDPAADEGEPSVSLVMDGATINSEPNSVPEPVSTTGQEVASELEQLAAEFRRFLINYIPVIPDEAIEAFVNDQLKENLAGYVENSSSKKLRVYDIHTDLVDGGIQIKFDYTYSTRGWTSKPWGGRWYTPWVSDSGSISAIVKLKVVDGELFAFAHSGFVRWESNNSIVRLFNFGMDLQTRVEAARAINDALTDMFGKGSMNRGKATDFLIQFGAAEALAQQFNVPSSVAEDYLRSIGATISANLRKDGIHINVRDVYPVTASARIGDTVYVIKEEQLHRIRSDGGYEKIGGRVWDGAVHMAAIGDSLYVLQNGYLHEVNPSTGAYRTISDQIWDGATSMSSAGNELFIVQADTLHRVTLTGAPGPSITSWKASGMVRPPRPPLEKRPI